MENQGNMQSKKKAAVIYFLAAFFIACIGIAGANYSGTSCRSSCTVLSFHCAGNVCIRRSSSEENSKME